MIVVPDVTCHRIPMLIRRPLIFGHVGVAWNKKGERIGVIGWVVSQDKLARYQGKYGEYGNELCCGAAVR